MLPKDSTVKEHCTIVGLPLSSEKRKKYTHSIFQCIPYYCYTDNSINVSIVTSIGSLNQPSVSNLQKRLQEPYAF